MRANVYIDGFNLYHALQADHHKWLNLRALSRVFLPPESHVIGTIYYFSAYATWRPASYKRHREYIKALEATGVTPVLGSFKAKDRMCKMCGAKYIGHEEKESDINIAVNLLNDAVEDRFDLAILISSDSDLCPALRLVKSKYPGKEIRIVTPRPLKTSYDLVSAAGGTGCYRQIRPVHFGRSLFAEQVLDAEGNIAAVRPPKYAPPA